MENYFLCLLMELLMGSLAGKRQLENAYGARTVLCLWQSNFAVHLNWKRVRVYSEGPVGWLIG